MTSAMDLLPDYLKAQITSRKGGLRDDLLAIPAAEAEGWKVTFRNDHWHNSASFERNGLHVWYIGPAWQTAYLIDGRYQHHKRFRSLAEALKRDINGEKRNEEAS